MIEIKNKLREKILKTLMENYNITIEELENKIRIKKTLLNEELKKLQKENIISFDILPDKVFIRLLREDFIFTEMKKQDKELKKKIKKKPERKNYEGMYI